MLGALLAPAVQLSAEWYGLPVPQIAYANALWQIQGLEETLLEQELADPAVMKPMLTAVRVARSAQSCWGSFWASRSGLAALPNVLSRHSWERAARAARWSAVWALAFAAAVADAGAGACRLRQAGGLEAHCGPTALTQLPEWIFTYGGSAWSIFAVRAATDAASRRPACAALPDAERRLAPAGPGAQPRHGHARRARDHRARPGDVWRCSPRRRLQPSS